MAASNAPPKLRLSRFHLHQLYRQMLRTRRFEAKRVDLAGVADDEDLREALDLDSMDFMNFVTGLAQRSGRPIA